MTRSKAASSRRAAKTKGRPHTLAIDIGGTGLKASVLNSAGRMVADRVRIATPDHCTPKVLLRSLAALTRGLPDYERVSVGFPGVIRNGLVITAPHFGTDVWRNFPLEKAISDLFHKPARMLNDAEVQGLAIVKGKGLEVVLTLGTGVGSAVFSDGRLAPHLELAHHPLHGKDTYNDYLGNAALHKHGKKRWNRRLRNTIDVVLTLLNYDRLYLSGGNATHITFDLPDNVKIASNDAGITGGIHLWDQDLDATTQRGVYTS
jgi:polyphosphate glucokinase